MRTLVIYVNNNGDVVSTVLTHKQALKLNDDKNKKNVGNALGVDPDNVVYTIEMPGGDFTPVIADRFGESIPMDSLSL